ncbi:unnamed protein product [Vicia faba]|uniref:Uncharacterized protein n=1 Tax=Vicia faba TaxID=3906 RepID=A0AAV1B5G4_VICFA|nr:unnamed protein product [Vicia faba]
MGGLGKTTLARKVYNSDKVKNHFNFRAWAYASRECRARELLLHLLQKLMPKNDYECRSSTTKKGQKKHKEAVNNSQDISNLSDEELKKRVWECLKCKNRDPPYNLQFLSEEKSWELFSKKRLLANKKNLHREWSKVFGHVNWYLTRDETQVKNVVLKLSFDNLPARLKPCFLYLGIFPEDYKICVRKLLQLWMAEVFIQEIGSRDAYDVAEDYLYELIDRNLIQVARVKGIGGVKTCRIHDLLRDLCILESKEDKLFQV